MNKMKGKRACQKINCRIEKCPQRGVKGLYGGVKRRKTGVFAKKVVFWMVFGVIFFALLRNSQFISYLCATLWRYSE